MKWSEFVTDYLNFTRKERIGVLIISALIVLVCFFPKILSSTSRADAAEVDSSWIAAVKRLEIIDSNGSKNDDKKNGDENTFAYQYDRRKNTHFEQSSIKGELFYFDPNTISIVDWKRLGLREKTIQTIQKYLSKGGRFYKPEDLQKVYGLHHDEYERLSPFVKIESTVTASGEVLVSSKSFSEKRPANTYAAKFSIININIADTSAFVALPGIGSKLALRIVTFREKLGGFYSIDQVGETYGLADSIFQVIKQYLKVENTSLRKININTATIDELKAHPYIKFNLANPIIAYRNEHGAFSKIEDVKKVMAVTDEVYKKISPYLFVQ